MVHRFASERAFVAALRSGTFPFEQWTHEAHVRLAYFTVWEKEFSFEKTLASLRADIQHYNASYKHLLTVGYHESITHFWAHMVQASASQCGPLGLREFLQRDKLGVAKSSTLFEYYSRPRLFDNAQAKTIFIEPDLKPLP
jgi:hypothetical protein